MKLLPALSMCVVVATACNPAKKADPSASASPTPSPSASPAKIAGLASLTGVWTVKLTPKQEQDLRTMSLVFEEAEPTEAQLATLGPDERASIAAIREARKKSPDDPQFQQMRQVISGMGGSRLRITTSSMSLDIGAVHQDAQLVVKTESSTAVMVSAVMSNGKSEDVQFLIDGPDAIRMARPGQKDALSFTRVK